MFKGHLKHPVMAVVSQYKARIVECFDPFILNSFLCVSFFLPFLGPLPEAYGGSQARGLIGAVAAGLCHSHSNAGSEPHL